MKITNLKVQNYKGLRDVEIPMSRFACLIGENNSGKSSILQAISLFFSGSSLSVSHYFDESKEIRIELSFSDISAEDLSRLVEEHRTKIEPIVKEGKLVLVRVYNTDGKGMLKYRCMMPREERFKPENIDLLVKGQKPGKPFVDKVMEAFPELKEKITTASNQTNVRETINEWADFLPDDQKELVDMVLPTGIDKSISAMLPEPIYIPAVKDLTDDIKAKEGTPFSKILGILLKAIEPSLAEEKELFAKLESKLNRVTLADGTVQDNRLAEVKIIEKTVEKYVCESFSNILINIKIPPPELKTVLSSAKIYANDGVDGLIESKGDGLRRATVFAILRSYVDLRKKENLISEQTQPEKNRYLLLFEEPELYLHPKGQQILFDALSVFSEQHSVVVTTHSPMFFGPEATATFIKLSKLYDNNISPKPFTKAHPIDLSNLDAKAQFQIICYENNNAAFFADTVVLVEGDSDYLVFPHLAEVINPEWNCSAESAKFTKINGKTSIKRYTAFFAQFDTRIVVIADLDILVDGFEQVDPDDNLKQKRSQLLQRLDEIVIASTQNKQTSSKEVRSIHEKQGLRSLWAKVKKTREEQKDGRGSLETVEDAVDEFFAYERKNERLEILKHTTEQDILTLKQQLLSELRNRSIFVLEKGSIEDYYPEGIQGTDKPTRAQSFCNKITTKEAALALCNEVKTEGNGNCKEFELVFESVFQNNKEMNG
jgi:putative ATP-dependent endonuclease of OLD family